MESILVSFVIIIGIIVLASIINEKKLHMPQEIAILSISFLISLFLLIFQKTGIINLDADIINHMKDARVDNFLLECTLGFMLFAGASKIHLNKFVKNLIPILSLSVVTTLVSSVAYGALFYLVSLLFNMNIDVWLCMLLGALISPTDPIAATGVLGKLGISKSLISVIEGEALFNDGLAVALFIFLKGMITSGTGGNIFLIVFKEILGAVFVGFVISYLLYKLLKMTNNPILHILKSLLDVALSYVICEHFGFSGVIASVICGMYFAYQDRKAARWKAVVDSKDLYNDFWNIVENLLNSILFVLVGFSILSLTVNEITFVLIPVAIILNLICRYVGVGISSILVGKKNIPNKYNKNEFVSLLTWCGLKGGLSLALALTTRVFLPPDIYNIIINVIVTTILFTTIVQGLSINKIYRIIEKNRERRYAEKSLKIV